jgi:hypothetical protein
MTPKPPKNVSRFEANLLAILRASLGKGLPDGVFRILQDPMVPPACLSANAVALVKDSLAKGVVLNLVRAGGWRNEASLPLGEPVVGRAWERHTAALRQLSFGPHTLGFLNWITAESIKEPNRDWDPPIEELTPADELYLMFAFDAFRGQSGVTAVLRSKKAFRRNSFCWLAHPAEINAGDTPHAPEFDLGGLRGVLIECLQPWLQARWFSRELRKTEQSDWHVARAGGRAEEALLASYLSACERAGRWDLARFLVRTLSRLLSGPRAAREWFAALPPGSGLRLGEQTETKRAVLSVVRSTTVLDRWNRTMQGVGYFDDGYAGSQLWKAEWERAAGADLVQRARGIVDEIEPLRANV